METFSTTYVDGGSEREPRLRGSNIDRRDDRAGFARVCEPVPLMARDEIQDSSTGQVLSGTGRGREPRTEGGSGTSGSPSASTARTPTVSTRRRGTWYPTVDAGD